MIFSSDQINQELHGVKDSLDAGCVMDRVSPTRINQHLSQGHYNSTRTLTTTWHLRKRKNLNQAQRKQANYTMQPILRVARPTTNISALLPFYLDGLGFSIIGQFEDHASFDGVILGHKKAPYHLEFTQEHGASPSSIGSPSPEHLLVFYFPEKGEWKAAVEKMRTAGYDAVKSHNPYWEVNGQTYEDPDGYRVVLQQAAWSV
jgi:hypothetical protein